MGFHGYTETAPVMLDRLMAIAAILLMLGFSFAFAGPAQQMGVQRLLQLNGMPATATRVVKLTTGILTVLLIRLPPRQPSTAKRAVFRDMKEGYGFVLGNPQARVLFMMTLINPLFLIPLHMGILPILAKDVFDGGASSLGIMLGALGGGGIIGTRSAAKDSSAIPRAARECRA